MSQRPPDPEAGARRFLLADGELEPAGESAPPAPVVSAPEPRPTASKPSAPRPAAPKAGPARPRPLAAPPSRGAGQVAAALDRLLPSRFTSGADQIFGMVALALDPQTRHALAVRTGNRDNSAFVREALAWAAEQSPGEVLRWAAEVDRGRRRSGGFARAVTCRMAQEELQVLDTLGVRTGLKRKPTLEGCVALRLAFLQAQDEAPTEP